MARRKFWANFTSSTRKSRAKLESGRINHTRLETGWIFCFYLFSIHADMNFPGGGVMLRTRSGYGSEHAPAMVPNTLRLWFRTRSGYGSEHAPAMVPNTLRLWFRTHSDCGSHLTPAMPGWNPAQPQAMIYRRARTLSLLYS